jgi:hypothetical protein
VEKFPQLLTTVANAPSICSAPLTVSWNSASLISGPALPAVKDSLAWALTPD